MYVPRHFAADDADVQSLLAATDAADLVTATATGLLSTFLPLLHVPDVGTHDVGRHGVGRHGALQGHVARNNPQWREAPVGGAMVIVRGPDGYVSPSWYATKREHGRVVPTWNYVSAHVYGELVVHDDDVWLADLVRRLTDRHEGTRSEPWSVDDAPQRFTEGQLRAVVGVELRISRVEAKLKLSQNRSDADVDGVVEGRAADGQDALAEAVREQAGRGRTPAGGAPA